MFSCTSSTKADQLNCEQALNICCASKGLLLYIVMATFSRPQPTCWKIEKVLGSWLPHQASLWPLGNLY